MTLKTLPMLLALVFLSAGLLNGCASAPRSAPLAMADAAAPITASSATLVVHGMSCPLCVSNVDKQLLTIPGVQSANVNLKTGEVKVALADGARVTKAQLAKAVDSSGFTLVEVRTP